MPQRPASPDSKRRSQRKKLLRLPDAILAKAAERLPDTFDRDSVLAMFALRSLSRRIIDYTNANLARYSISAAKFNYLLVLYLSPDNGLTLNEISQLIHTSNATVSSIMVALEQDGLIRRRPNEHDARSTIVALTAKGRELLEFVAPPYHRRNISAMAELSQPERAKLVDFLMRVAEGFEQEFETKR